jgi:N-methylhydantoinase A/oxoprolinase/acetone carboxylase beta subunit
MTSQPSTIQPTSSSIFRLGFDIGATFTDLALQDTRTAALHVNKRLTTPHDPEVIS